MKKYTEYIVTYFDKYNRIARTEFHYAQTNEEAIAIAKKFLYENGSLAKIGRIERIGFFTVEINF